jgi:methyl-accepting chemotaxis protein
MAIFSAALLLSMILYGVKLAKNQALTIKALRKLAGGQALAEHRYNPESYSGQLSNATIATNLAFLENREESAYQLDQASQLKMAMDKLKSNVMIVDQNYNIMYLNTSMEAFLVNREARLKELLPHFNARQLMGKNIDLFHTHPAHQREIIGKLEQPVAATIVVAGYHLELTMLPIKNRMGVRTATLVEWNDRTQEVQLLQNVGATVKKAQQGYLGERIDVSQLEGVALELSDSINQLLGSIQGAMQDVIRVTSGMANGDLTNIIDNHFDGELGELKEAINSSISRLDGVISIAIQASVIVDGAAREVSQGSHDLSARVQEQAAALEKTSATMEEMSSTIQLNTENTREASKVAQGVQLKANEGAEVMGRTIEAMQAIQQSSHKIADIVSLIDGIAFQTNLLALNAAVEAARAGEHGRGFAVVASEVRALAQKSANAAKDIKHLINESVTRIDQGTQLAGQSGQVLTGITGSINDVSAMIEHIARATQEQAQGIHQVHDAITSIDQVTQQNAALVEETAAASESLSDQSKSLTREMSFFKTSSRAHTASAKLNKPMTKVLPPKAQPGLVTKEPVKRMSKNLPTNINDEWSDF